MQVIICKICPEKKIQAKDLKNIMKTQKIEGVNILLIYQLVLRKQPKKLPVK
jgi:hypothetical protein